MELGRVKVKGETYKKHIARVTEKGNSWAMERKVLAVMEGKGLDSVVGQEKENKKTNQEEQLKR